MKSTVIHLCDLLCYVFPLFFPVLKGQQSSWIKHKIHSCMQANNCLVALLAKGGRWALQGVPVVATVGYQLPMEPNGIKTIKGWRPFTLTVTEDRQHMLLANLPTSTSHMLAENTTMATYSFSPASAGLQILWLHQKYWSQAIACMPCSSWAFQRYCAAA